MDSSESFINKPIKSTSMSRVLKGLRAMLDHRNNDVDPAETVRFTAETRAYILRYANQVKSRFIREKCLSIPELTLHDFNNRARENTGVLGLFFSSNRNPVRDNEVLRRKLDEISYGIEAILQVIENPELEKMYYTS